MKKLLLTAIAAVCLTGSLAVAEDFVTQDEWNEIMNEWIQFNGRDNREAINGVLDEIQDKIKEEFPMDPEMQLQLEALKTDKEAAMAAKAKEFGYDDYRLAVREHVAVNEIFAIEQDFDNQINSLTNDYYEEFWGRYRTTCADAIERIMENAEKMK